MKENSNNGVVVCLFIIIVILTGMVVLFASGIISVNKETKSVDKKDNVVDSNVTSDNKSNSKSISDVVGVYKGSFESIENNEGNTTYYAVLVLYEDGVFAYTSSSYVPFGVIGNYVLNDNKIVLNKWFNTGSDVSLKITKGLKELTINSDGSITDKNVKIPYLSNAVIPEINMNKTNDSIPDFDLGNRLGVAFFDSTNHEIEDPRL